MRHNVGQSDPACRLCALGGTARLTCIPTTPYSCVWPRPRRSRRQALLIVGKWPGYEEDQCGLNFVGASGGVLQNVLLGTEIPALTDIYLTNAVRCYVPAGNKMNKTWLKACATYLDADIAALASTYRRLTLLCLGADAALSLLGCSQKESFSRQGAHGSQGYPTFSTYHPALLLYTGGDAKACKPQYVGAVGSHMTLLLQHLRGEETRSAWTIKTPTPYQEPPHGTDS